jgi:hypothetical protein
MHVLMIGISCFLGGIIFGILMLFVIVIIKYNRQG